MKHVFIVDPEIFHGQQWKMDGLLDTIGQFFRTQEKPNFSTLVSRYPRDAIGLIQKQIDEAEEGETVRVYAMGGDEILFDCLNGIAGLPDMELGIMPSGADNTFIRAFGDGKAALFNDIPTMIEASVIPTDMVKVGNNCVLNGCSVGLLPAVAVSTKGIRQKMQTGLSRRFIGLFLFVNRLVSLFDRELIAHHYEISVDGNDISGNYSQIHIINNPCFARRRHGLVGAMPDDGVMDVVLFKSMGGPFMTSSSIRRYARGKMPSNCVRIQARKVEIKTEKPMFIQTDSEFLTDTHMTFEVVPGAVQVVSVNNLAYQGF